MDIWERMLGKKPRPKWWRPGKYKCPKCDAFIAIVDQFKRYNDLWFKKHCRYSTWCNRCGWEWTSEMFKKDLPVLRLITPFYNRGEGPLEYGLSEGHATKLGCNVMGSVRFRWQGRLLAKGYIEMGNEGRYVEVN